MVAALRVAARVSRDFPGHGENLQTIAARPFARSWCAGARMPDGRLCGRGAKRDGGDQQHRPAAPLKEGRDPRHHRQRGRRAVSDCQRALARAAASVFRMAPGLGFEPRTDRLTADCSTAELPRKRPSCGRAHIGQGPLASKRFFAAGGAARSRTGVAGFAVPCMAALPRRRPCRIASYRRARRRGSRLRPCGRRDCLQDRAGDIRRVTRVPIRNENDGQSR